MATTADEVWVRVVGRGTFQNSQPLRRFTLDRMQHGYRRFTVDVGDCTGMDSTFLGVLAGVGLRLRQDGRTDARVRLVRVGQRNLELLQTLGLDRLLVVVQETPDEPAGGLQWEWLPDSDIESLSKPLDKDETTDLMLSAHDNLIQADQRNAPRFQTVTKFLRDSLERRRNQPSSQ
ncbi:MAG: STAS domain-containing protein [Verrucomicrobiae bacterium]|nr:STAS domain-containing protein [Verrucomicrobiae bacterium]MDW8343403.1 STAS domain-containing protein [Verrucomicrobiae bacterium]